MPAPVLNVLCAFIFAFVQLTNVAFQHILSDLLIFLAVMTNYNIFGPNKCVFVGNLFS